MFVDWEEGVIGEKEIKNIKGKEVKDLIWENYLSIKVKIRVRRWFWFVEKV